MNPRQSGILRQCGDADDGVDRCHARADARGGGLLASARHGNDACCNTPLFYRLHNQKCQMPNRN